MGAHAEVRLAEQARLTPVEWFIRTLGAQHKM